jgi:hypothetical protein
MSKILYDELMEAIKLSMDTVESFEDEMVLYNLTCELSQAYPLLRETGCE